MNLRFAYLLFVTEGHNQFNANKTGKPPALPIRDLHGRLAYFFLMERLRSPYIPAVIMVSVLLFTVKHSAVVLMAVSPVKTGSAWLDWVYSAGAVITLDAAVFIFAIHRMKWQAIVFAVAIFAINLIYFLSDIPHRNLIAASLLSAAFAYAVYSFTELFVKDFARLMPKAKAQPKAQGETEMPETEKRKRKPKDPRASLRAKRSQLRKRLSKEPDDISLQEKLTEIETLLSQ